MRKAKLSEKWDRKIGYRRFNAATEIAFPVRRVRAAGAYRGQPRTIAGSRGAMPRSCYRDPSPAS